MTAFLFSNDGCANSSHTSVFSSQETQTDTLHALLTQWNYNCDHLGHLENASYCNSYCNPSFHFQHWCKGVLLLTLILTVLYSQFCLSDQLYIGMYIYIYIYIYIHTGILINSFFMNNMVHSWEQERKRIKEGYINSSMCTKYHTINK